MIKKIFLFLLISIFWTTTAIFAQSFFMQHGSILGEEFIRAQLKNDSITFHSSILEPAISIDSITLQRFSKNYNSNSYQKKNLKPFTDGLISIQSKKHHLFLNPVFHNTYGLDAKQNDDFFITGAGAAFQYHYKNKIAAYADFISQQSTFPNYTDTFIQQYHCIPGQGLAKHSGSGYTYHNYRYYLSYQLNPYFNFAFGNLKNHWGDGFHSLILSNNPVEYPYFKITTNIWKIKYINLFANFLDLQKYNGNKKSYRNKFASFHYLSVILLKKINLSFFEGIIWQAADEFGYRGFDVNYINPVIYYRPVESSMDSPDNAIIGVNGSYRFLHGNMVYGQVVLDEFKLQHVRDKDGWYANKQAFQVGYKTYEPFGLKNLFMQYEYHRVRPFMYSHQNATQNYTHFNQSLAHPLNCNFKEHFFNVTYHMKRWFMQLKYQDALFGNDTATSNLGNDIFKPYLSYTKEFGNTMLQGQRNHLQSFDLSLHYLINPKQDLRIYSGFLYRKQKNDFNIPENQYLYFGLSSSFNKLFPGF